jgi:hypothetical protein
MSAHRVRPMKPRRELDRKPHAVWRRPFLALRRAVLRRLSRYLHTNQWDEE